MAAQTCYSASRHLLAQGREELYLGDTRQASEKGWRAASQMVKHLAEQRGWEHQDHAALYKVISRLVAETGDDDIRRLFHVAVSLETNFYENWDNARNIDGGLDDVALLLDRLAPLGDGWPVPGQGG